MRRKKKTDMTQNVMIMGKYVRKPIYQVDTGYLEWLYPKIKTGSLLFKKFKGNVKKELMTREDSKYYKGEKKNPKKQRKIRKLEKIKLNKYAIELNTNIPKSELWFRQLYMDYRHKLDKDNFPLFQYIPDIINQTYRYVIEIDGSIHETPKQKKKDRIKDNFYIMHDFFVIRIKAYDKDSFDIGMKQLLEIRKKMAPHKKIRKRKRCVRKHIYKLSIFS